jgi:hypothetical protein
VTALDGSLPAKRPSCWCPLSKLDCISTARRAKGRQGAHQVAAVLEQIRPSICAFHLVADLVAHRLLDDGVRECRDLFCPRSEGGPEAVRRDRLAAGRVEPIPLRLSASL